MNEVVVSIVEIKIKQGRHVQLGYFRKMSSGNLLGALF